MMSEKSNGAETDLRRQAEEKAGRNFAQEPEKMEKLSVETGKLLHELRVHQIELEMQNEELRASRQELEASRARYFELYNLAPVGYITIGENGLILEGNLTFATLVDMPMGTLLRQPFSQLVINQDQDKYYLWKKRLIEKTEPQVCELRLLKKDGTDFWVRLLSNLAEKTDGAKVIRAVVSDITGPKLIQGELASANLKIEEASKAKSNFLANMSHELRTPLNTIIGFSEVLQDKLFGPLNEKQESFVINILSSGRHLLSLINDILDISKVEAHKMELNLEQINLGELCRDTLAMFSEKVRKQQITLSYDIDAGMNEVTFVADARKIKQIMFNLVDNGIKFNHPNGSVSIKIQITSDTFNASAIRIVVEDTGIGIAEEDQAKLFLPFSQLTQSYYDKKTEGTGLGLALSKHLAEMHGGSIMLQSEYGKGSRFTACFPIR